MPIHSATVTIKKKDQSFRVVVENIVVTGNDYEDMKRSPENLRRALRYMNSKAKRVHSEDETRWVIIDIIIHKRLDMPLHERK